MKMPAPEKLAYSFDEAMTLTGIGATSLRRAIKEGRLVARKNGAHLLIIKEDLQRFLHDMPVAGGPNGDTPTSD